MAHAVRKNLAGLDPFWISAIAVIIIYNEPIMAEGCTNVEAITLAPERLRTIHIANYIWGIIKYLCILGISSLVWVKTFKNSIASIPPSAGKITKLWFSIQGLFENIILKE